MLRWYLGGQEGRRQSQGGRWGLLASNTEVVRLHLAGVGSAGGLGVGRLVLLISSWRGGPANVLRAARPGLAPGAGVAPATVALLSS